MAFWKPGTAYPGGPALLDRESERETAGPEGVAAVVYNPNAHLSLARQRQALPIYENRTHILYLVETYPVVVIVGQTGCGKTTQVPQFLHEAGWTSGGRLVACTQPRRVAAVTVAQRVAEEMGVKLGEEVGYSIRFDDVTDPIRTRLKYMTDGMLVREMMLDPLLQRYSVIMVDEAHERSLHTDIILGLLKKIQRKRDDLRIIISSATVDAEAFKEFFNANPNPRDPSKDSVNILSVEGRQYPVDVLHLQRPVSDYIQEMVNTVLELHRQEGRGDILAFLTGQEEIDTLCELLREKARELPARGLRLQALPLYSGLPPDQQLQCFETAPKNTRKVIVATNIAETSVTIPGIAYVVDCGFVKIRTYDPRADMEALVVVPLSQASANQRAGRAGRVRAGRCYRLFTEEAYHSILPKALPPEMQRTNLVTVVLQMKALGVDNILHFDFMSPPPVEMMVRALELLYSLGALDDAAKLTRPLGVAMAEFPTDPMLAKLLFSSKEFGCTEEILTIASMLSIQSIFTTQRDTRGAIESVRRQFGAKEGDHLTLLNVYNSWIAAGRDPNWCHRCHVNPKAMLRASDVRKQLAKYLRRFGSAWNDTKGTRPSTNEQLSEAIRKCIVTGYFSHAARAQADGTFRTIRGDMTLSIHPNSVLFRDVPEWVVFHEVVQTAKEFMREVTVISPIWLSELAPHFYEYKKPREVGKRPPAGTDETL